MVERARTVYLLMRLGGAFALLYPPIHAYFEPNTWVGYLPGFVRLPAQAGGLPDLALLHVFGAVEIVLALWILSGIKIFWPSITATVLLVAIVVSNPHEFPILFRDLSIALLTFALALTQAPRQRVAAEPSP